MKLSPEMIREQRFKIKMSGFDKNEVIAFLMDIAEDMEMLIEENAILKSEVDSVQRRQKDLEDIFIAAKQFSDDTKKRAEHDASVIVSEAEKKAEDIHLATTQRQAEIEQRLQDLHTQATQKAREILRDAERTKLELEKNNAELNNKRTSLINELQSILDSYRNWLREQG